jgi:hypothetical protein
MTTSSSTGSLFKMGHTPLGVDPNIPVVNWSLGFGLAACPALNLLVTSQTIEKTVTVWDMSTHHGGLTLLYTLGGATSSQPMQFHFTEPDGRMAFCAATPSLVLVTDNGQDVVHVLDVVHRTHEGYLCPPGTISGPRGVASTGTGTADRSLVAVSAFKCGSQGDHVVTLVQGNKAAWEVVRVIDSGFEGFDLKGPFATPHGVRFTRDGSRVCVTNVWGAELQLFRVEDGTFDRNVVTALAWAYDVEEVEEGWLSVNDFTTVVFIPDGTGPAHRRIGMRPLDSHVHGVNARPIAIVAVPRVGIFIRDIGTPHMRLLVTPDIMAMNRMSNIRVAWMTAAHRATVWRGLM